MRDPFIAVDATTDLRARARELRRSWESAMGDTSVRGGVRPVIEQSWRRLAASGRDPQRLRPRRAFELEALEPMRAASPLRDVIDVLRGCLGAIADDAEHVMVVVDGAGRILWIEGHPRVRHQADGITFGEGMLWTEESAGTNAIGTALAIDHAVQIFTAEHFLSEQHPWWCSAAPIHDPVSGEALGVVDLSGPMRTAHPHSLALVRAAARMAEHVLAARQSLHDDELRRAYFERADGAGPSALLAADGRVLACRPHGWLSGPLPTPRAGATIALADGRQAVVEPLAAGDGWVLRELPTGSGRAWAPPRVRLCLLGRARPTIRLGDEEPRPLTLRHAEILALLALHRDGLTAEQLTLHLYGDDGNRVSTRAEVSRLRKLLGGAMAARPYRLVGQVDADFLDVEALLIAGELQRALDAYTGPLLPDSEAPRLAQARDELVGALQRAVLAAPPERLWRWLESEGGRDDAAAMAAFVRATGPADPRRAVIAARLRTLQVRWARSG